MFLIYLSESSLFFYEYNINIVNIIICEFLYFGFTKNQ